MQPFVSRKPQQVVTPALDADIIPNETHVMQVIIKLCFITSTSHANITKNSVGVTAKMCGQRGVAN